MENNDMLQEPLLERALDDDNSDEFSKGGIWSDLTFMWLNPLFKKGYAQKLRVEDIPNVPRLDASDQASFVLEEALRLRNTLTTPSLQSAILYSVWMPLAINAVFAGTNTIASYIGPLLITSFVKFLSEKHDNSKWQQGLVLSFIFFFAKMVESLAQRQWYFGAHRIGIRVRAALMALTYKKSLTVKHGSVSTGKVINFLNVDVERIGDFFMYIHWIWLLPFQVIFALVILYMNLGAAPSAAAFVATIVVMVSNIPFASMQKRLQTKIMEAKDSRIKATSEILKNMKILKLHSWETAFFNKLLKLRETEKGWLRKYLYTCSAVAFLFWASPTLVSVVTFGVCVVTNTPLTAGTVLSALATFRILQEPIYNLPELISTVVQTKVSVKRMQDFIGEEDQQKLTSYHASDTSEVALEIEPGEYAWEYDDSKKSTIKINDKITIKKGSKVAICGSVGSGKSSLLCSIMGEIPKVSGSSIKSYGSKALVAQTAVISCLRELRKRQKLEELSGKYTPYFSLLHIKEFLLPLYFCATFSSKGCKLQAITGLHGEQKQKAGCPERNCSGYLSCYLGEAPSLYWEGQFCFRPLQLRLLSSSLFRWPNQSFEHLCHSLTPHLQAEFSIDPPQIKARWIQIFHIDWQG